MAALPRRAGLKVEIPKDESPRLGRVGLIAAVGFAIGAVWPSIADFKLVPSAPATATPGLAGEPVAPSAAAALPSAPPAAPEPAEDAGPAPVVSEPQVTSCRTEGGRKVESCDAIDIDRVARPLLLGLASCEGASELSGVLSLGLELDFKKGAIVRLISGKSTSLVESEAESLIACARTRLSAVKLDGVPHEHAEYTVFYRVEFTPAPAAAEGGDSGKAGVEVTPATGRATVSWEVALVRAAPSREGKIVARVLSGTRVVVTGKNGDWYQIKYDAKGSEGWVYRTAIGL